MQRISVWVLVAILCAVSVSALGDGKWNYVLFEQDPLRPPFDADSLTEEPPAQSTFADFLGEVPVKSTNQAIEHNHDYYRVFLQSLSAKTVTLGIDCCFCKAQLNDAELVPEPLPDGTAKITLALEEGWNKLEVDQLGDNPPSSKYSPFCDKELTLSKKLSTLVDGVSTAPFKCDPANDCCKPDGSDLKEEGALCQNGDGQCDGNGKCSDPDGNPEECIEKFGEGAFLDSGSNKCCGDDKEKDCFSYNNGFFCQPGSGWQQLSGRVGQVLKAGCFGNANVVLDANEPKICFLTPPPLDYTFAYEVVSAKGNNKWKHFQNGVLKGEIDDKQFLATPFQGGTETKVETFVHVTSNVAVNLKVECKVGPVQPGQPSARVVKVNDQVQGPGSREGADAQVFSLNLVAGDNKVTITCKNNGFDSGDKHLFLTPKLGDQVFSLSSKLPDGGMVSSEEFEATLQKRNESLGDVSDFADVPSGGGSSSPFEEEEDTAPDPNVTVTTRVLVRSADVNISFQYQGNVSNPRVTGTSGDLRAIYTGPPPQPPKGVFQRTVINNHGYLCVESVTDPDRKEVVECAGDPGLSKYFSKENAVQAKIGDARFALDDGGNNVIHWCSGFGPWVSDLDTRQTGHLTCEAARTIQGAKSNFGFTGNRCCGDDPGEYYNDPFSEGFDKHGGCFDSKKVDFGEFPLETNPKTASEGVITNYLGVFQACDATPPGVTP